MACAKDKRVTEKFSRSVLAQDMRRLKNAVDTKVAKKLKYAKLRFVFSPLRRNPVFQRKWRRLKVPSLSNLKFLALVQRIQCAKDFLMIRVPL